MSPRAKASVFLVLAFVLGVAAGALGFGVYLRQTSGRPTGPERFQNAILHRLSSELDLQPEQRARVESILRETGQEFSRLREEMRPRFREIRARSRERIRGVLDAQQQAKFESLSADWDRRAERWRR
jgi:Spy/CpxP family protein refolding chaperone